MDIVRLIHYERRHKYASVYINDELEDIFDNKPTLKENIECAKAYLGQKYDKVEYIRTLTNSRGWDEDYYKATKE